MLDPKSVHLILSSRRWILSQPSGVNSGGCSGPQPWPPELVAAVRALPLWTKVHVWVGAKWSPVITHRGGALALLHGAARHLALTAMAGAQSQVEVPPGADWIERHPLQSEGAERAATALLPRATLQALASLMGWRCRLSSVAPLWSAVALQGATQALVEEDDALSLVQLTPAGRLVPLFSRVYADPKQLAAACEQRALSSTDPVLRVRLDVEATTTANLLALSAYQEKLIP